MWVDGDQNDESLTNERSSTHPTDTNSGGGEKQDNRERNLHGQKANDDEQSHGSDDHADDFATWGGRVVLRHRQCC
ncbi:uncharacterized protein BO95DRAFT_445434 [Aspergillus brunneoviolaceus CBS 621.78]|uniref:Uncharacterized protein n=1 Tax=Aspergillus brunneoviolaceus CBS 621.78 TaxID=1450534 RepID=A0ACD1G1R2_9EURO|nr:hypothetical protein BO95DRAFT_445434 [Aspergillus brunneoviolaceus CBS 621.78]RAH43132.1 hypothetical protein BO95DRAFT_445434 [Aspergillus brunneoviolaceus CBS 621.78]